MDDRGDEPFGGRNDLQRGIAGYNKELTNPFPKVEDAAETLPRSIMQIPILIEPVAGNGYLARGGEPLALSAEGASQEEALANLKEKLHARMCNGAVVVSLELPSRPHPLAEFAGMFKDDPLLKEWKKSVAAYRRKVDKDADRP